MTTLYQYCVTCATETGHTWIKDLVNQCIVCKRENKVSAAQVFVRPEKYAHLQKDEYEELMNKIEQEPEAKLEIPEMKEEKKPAPASVVHEPDLPVQGIFVKPTPLIEVGTEPKWNGDDTIRKPIPTGTGIQEQLPSSIVNPPKNLATPAEQIEAFQKVLQVTEHKIEEELNKALRPAIPQESLPKPPVKKGWADGL